MSISLSTMSLKVQPAPRMRIAPQPKSTINGIEGIGPLLASAMLHQHGQSSNHVPEHLIKPICSYNIL